MPTATVLPVMNPDSTNCHLQGGCFVEDCVNQAPYWTPIVIEMSVTYLCFTLKPWFAVTAGGQQGDAVSAHKHLIHGFYFRVYSLVSMCFTRQRSIWGLLCVVFVQTKLQICSHHLVFLEKLHNLYPMSCNTYRNSIRCMHCWVNCSGII